MMGLLRSTSRSRATPLEGVKVLLSDLDGVVYAGDQPLPHAVESLNKAAESVRVGYITNNASRTASVVASHLASFGLQCTADDVITSPQAAIDLLAQKVPAGSTILVVGGEGITHELSKNGYVITRSALDHPVAVVQGFSPDVGWKDLAEASFALNSEPSSEAFRVPENAESQEGVVWIATNMDWTIPVERGIAPGNGTLVSAVHTAVGRLPIVAGKPEAPIFLKAAERLGCESAHETVLVIGDRLDTDIAGGVKVGMKTALVLTGIDQAKQVLAAPKDSRPDYILGDLRELFEPYPQPVRHNDGSVSVRKAKVKKVGKEIVIVSSGTDKRDLLRATAQLIWDSGLAIYGFSVPEKIYS